MAEAKRIPPDEVHDKLERGEALLVCAYEDEAKCRDYMLEGALPLAQLHDVPEDQELVFYCA